MNPEIDRDLSGDDYLDKFDPNTFLHEFYDIFHMIPGNMKPFELFYQFLNQGDIDGSRWLNVGAGPTIHYEIAAPSNITEIVYSDFVEGNREALRRWLRQDPKAYDWTPYFHFYAKLRGICDVTKWQTEKEAFIRQAVTGVLSCDVRKSNPLEPLEVEPFDVVVSAFCLEQACSDLQGYKQVIKNAITLLRPGGHVVLIGSLQDSQYNVGKNTFKSMAQSESQMREALADANVDVVRMEIIESESCEISDSKSIYVLKGKKSVN